MFISDPEYCSHNIKLSCVIPEKKMFKHQTYGILLQSYVCLISYNISLLLITSHIKTISKLNLENVIVIQV